MKNYFKKLTFNPEVTHGVCPTCQEHTMLVSITRDFYRCVTCGADLEQKVKLAGYGYNPWVAAFYALEQTPRIPISKGAGKNKTYFLVSMMPSPDEDYFKRLHWDYGQEMTTGTPGSRTIGNQFLVYDYWQNIKKWGP